MAERKRNLVLRILLLLTLASSLVHGEKTQEDQEYVTFDFRVLRIGSGDFSGIKVEAQPGEVTELAFKRIQRSDLVQYAGINPVTFFREIPAPTLDDPNAVQRVTVAQFLVPQSLDEALLFFRPALPKDGDGLPFEIIAMDDSLSAFPKDSLVAVNASDVPLFGILGGDQLNLVSGANPAISFRSFLNRDFPMGFAVQTEDGPKLVFENQLQLEKDYRIILMLAPPRREGSIRLNVYSIPELIRDEQPTQEPDAG